MITVLWKTKIEECHAIGYGTWTEKHEYPEKVWKGDIWRADRDYILCHSCLDKINKNKDTEIKAFRYLGWKWERYEKKRELMNQIKKCENSEQTIEKCRKKIKKIEKEDFSWGIKT